MNFLAHLWLADASKTSLPGAILGDMVRGRDLSGYSDEVALGIRLHRRIDAVTDRHSVVRSARATIPESVRRYAGVLLDLGCDHLLARSWHEYSQEPLAAFCLRAAQEISNEAQGFRQAGQRAPEPIRFARLLQSYADEAGIDWALDRMTQRVRAPERLREAALHWRQGLPALAGGLPQLLDDLLHSARSMAAEQVADQGL